MQNILNIYRNKTFEYLSNAQGYSLEEIKTDNGSIWICQKKLEKINVIFIFSDANNINDINILVNILENQGKPYRIYNISLDNNINSRDIVMKNGLVNNIVIDSQNNSIIYAGSDCFDIAKLIIFVNSQNSKVTKRVNPKTYVTYGLIITNIIFYIISAVCAGNFMDIDIKTLYKLGAKVSYNIYNGEVWRLITSMFLHADIMHILCNMYSLFAIGSQIELIFGRTKYLIIYFVSGICAGILSCILSPNSLSVGASGAIFGLLGSFIVVVYFNRRNISKGVITNLILVVFINLYIGFSSNNIDNAAHIGGMFAGIIISLIMIETIKQRKKIK